MDNNTRQAMFAAYWGCEVGFKEKWIWVIDAGIIWEDIDENDKLLLTPLSKITDEHAQIVADIWNKHRNDFWKYTIDNIKDKLHEYGATVLVGGEIDTLRSLGYDCGFRDLDSLIAAGYAVDKTLSNG